MNWNSTLENQRQTPDRQQAIFTDKRWQSWKTDGREGAEIKENNGVGEIYREFMLHLPWKRTQRWNYTLRNSHPTLALLFHYHSSCTAAAHSLDISVINRRMIALAQWANSRVLYLEHHSRAKNHSHRKLVSWKLIEIAKSDPKRGNRFNSF